MKLMKRMALIPVLAALLMVALTAGVVMAEKQPDLEDNSITGGGTVITGTLTTESATFDRRFIVTTDLNCNASSSDSSNDGVYYHAFPFTVTDTDPIEAEATETGTTIGDTVFFIYCDPFDTSTPEGNLVAWNDDGGVGFRSAFTAADGISLTPGDVYWFTISTFSAGTTLGDYEIAFSSNVELLPHADMAGLNAILEPNGDATVAWETAAENGIDHFNVWRSDAPDGDLTQVNTDPIAAGAGTYSFTDSPGAGTWYYTVQVISDHGLSELHGPDLAEAPTDVSLTAFDGASNGAALPLAALMGLALLALGGFVLRRRTIS